MKQIKQIWLDWLGDEKGKEKSKSASYEGVMRGRTRRETTQIISQIQAGTVDSISERIFGAWVLDEPLDEWDSYVSDPITKKVSPLGWWSDSTRQEKWPQLSVFAIAALSFPPMSDEAERVFSGVRRTISWERSRLEPEIIEGLECFYHFLNQSSLRPKKK